MSTTYVCSACGATQDRQYDVRLVVTTCSECGVNGPSLNRALHELLDAIPEADRPDDWEHLSVEKRIRAALREGLVDPDQVRFG